MRTHITRYSGSGCVATIFLLLITGTSHAQQSSPPPPGCCTAEGTSRIATAGRFVDVGGVKLGMSPDETQAALKELNPVFRFTPQFVDDWEYDAGLVSIPSKDPKKRWLTGIQGNARDGDRYEQFTVRFTTPPSRPFVFSMERQVDFPQQGMPTIENMVSGLLKKYGPES